MLGLAPDISILMGNFLYLVVHKDTNSLLFPSASWGNVLTANPELPLLLFPPAHIRDRGECPREPCGPDGPLRVQLGGRWALLGCVEGQPQTPWLCSQEFPRILQSAASLREVRVCFLLLAAPMVLTLGDHYQNSPGLS